MRIPKKLLALGAFFIVAALVAGCGSSGGVPGNSVASLDGNPITKQAYDHWLYIFVKYDASQQEAPPVSPNDPPDFNNCVAQIHAQYPTTKKTARKNLLAYCKQAFTTDNAQVMGYLLETYWVQAQAAKQGVPYTQADLASEFKKFKKLEFPTAAKLAAYTASTGQTVDDVKFQLRVEKLYDDLVIRASKKATSKAIAQYYNAHKANFGTPEAANVHLVRTTSQAKATAAYDALNSGQSWDQVAKQYAADASSRANGGLLTGVTSQTEEKAVNAAIFASPLNKVVAPIHGLFGWYVLEVVKITKATQQPLSQASKTIKATLTQQYEAAGAAKVNKAIKANWGSKTQCRAIYATSGCADYKAPSTTATTTPAGTTTTAAGTTTTAASTTTTKSKTSTTSTGQTVTVNPTSGKTTTATTG